MTFTFTLEDRKESFEVTVYGAEMNLVIKDLDGKVKKEYEKLPINILTQTVEVEANPEELEEDFDEDDDEDIVEEDLSFDSFFNPENMQVEQGMTDLCDGIKNKAVLKRLKPVLAKRINDIEGIGIHFYNAAHEESFDTAMTEFKASISGIRDTCNNILDDLGGEEPTISRGLGMFFGGFGKRHA